MYTRTINQNPKPELVLLPFPSLLHHIFYIVTVLQVHEVSTMKSTIQLCIYIYCTVLYCTVMYCTVL